MDDIIKEFLVEGHENLDRLERGLVELEADPAEPATLAAIFRTMHTIKGTAGFLGLKKLEHLTHVAESLLAKLRDGALRIDSEIASALLATSDAVRRMLKCVEATERDGDDDELALTQRLASLAQPAPAPEAAAPAPPAAMPAPSAPGDTTIRVDVELLDKLMNLVGELVLARNQVMQHAAVRDGEVAHAAQRLDAITTELQEGVMKTRMQPIGSVWSKFPRVVRDLSLACGKKVRLETEGRDTELDRSLLEAIRDPLTHIVRNAIDHGIEPPEERARLGKPHEGVVRMRAFHEGGHVHLEVSDDGRGIDPAALKAKAIEKGLIAPELAEQMTDREAIHLVFRAGFSTASRVTSVSGRGVGMDVVKSNIEKIGGTADVQSEAGRGTTIRMQIPLTLTIIPALTVACGGDRYCIPQVSLLELLRLEGEQARKGVESVHGVPMHRLRGRLLPLVFLADELRLPRDGSAPAELNIVVLRADGPSFGLVVEKVGDTEEIVVKALGAHLKGIPVFQGATIMGDGRVALILDVPGLAQRARLVCTTDHGGAVAGISAAAQRESAPALLLFTCGDGGRMALELDQVARLEEFARESIEGVGGGEVVQYRGGILPLLDVRHALQERRRSPRGASDPRATGPATVQVVVLRAGERHLGLMVGRILDIAREEAGLERRPGTRRGVKACAVVAGRVAEILDVGSLLAKAGLAPAAGAKAGAP